MKISKMKMDTIPMKKFMVKLYFHLQFTNPPLCRGFSDFGTIFAYERIFSYENFIC